MNFIFFPFIDILFETLIIPKERIKIYIMDKKIKNIKQKLYILYQASKDKRISTFVRILIFLTIAYALSPIDLIPDFIPIIGYFDDLVLIPLAIWVIYKNIPKEIIKEYEETITENRIEPVFKKIGIFIVLLTWALFITTILKIV